MPEKFSSNEGGDFLKEKYHDLPKSPEVESAVKRQEVRTGEKIGNDPKEKIGAYLDRLNEIFNPEDEDKKEIRVDILKDKLHDKFVVKEIPESYFKQQQKIAREQGHGDVEITNQLRQEALKIITADQKRSLDAWVDYLGSPDATYPDWLKYWAFRSITGLSQYDKEAHEFKKRSKSTTAPFPDINREALAYVLDAVEKQQKEKTQKKGKKKAETESQQPTDEEWEKLLKTQNFAKLYAHAIEKITPASEEEKENIQGEWVKYEQGSDPTPLYESLQGHGTGWCTAGESTAKTQLEWGDFFVFYTKDKQGLNKVPRIAIRMQEGIIAEVRGIDAEQNLEPIMTDIAKEKIATLPGGDRYEKKVRDMKRLTDIEKRFINIKSLEREKDRIIQRDDVWDEEGKPISPWREEIDRLNQAIEDVQENAKEKNKQVELSKEELKFLYEIDEKIEGFGFKDDPRIQEIREQRDLKKDYATLFDCLPEQVAFDKSEINDNTSVFMGGKETLINVVEDEMEVVSGWGTDKGKTIKIKTKVSIGFIGKDIYPGAKNYEKLMEDMKQFVKIERKIESKEELTKDELIFLYEIDKKVEDIGVITKRNGTLSHYPLMDELREKRRDKVKDDLAVIFECQPENVSISQTDFNDQIEVCAYNAFFGEPGKAYDKMPSNLKFIRWTASFSRSNIEDLGQLQYIGGDASFDNSKVKNLGQLQKIGKSANFARSQVESLGQLQSIGTNVYIDKDSKLDFSGIKIGGEIISERKNN